MKYARKRQAFGASDLPLDIPRFKESIFDTPNNDDIDAAIAEAELIDEPPEQYLPCLLPSRKRERKQHGKPSSKGQCFLCAYVGEKETTLPSDDVQHIVDMIRMNVGRMQTSVLAEQVAEYYAIFRERINRTLARGERPLPPMSAATVIAHLRTHTLDPELKQLQTLEALQELREELIMVAMEKNNKTKQKRGNKMTIDNLDKIIKLELVLGAKDPSKMAYYSAGAVVNPAVQSQGVAARNTKTLFNYWGNAGDQ